MSYLVIPQIWMLSMASYPKFLYMYFFIISKLDPSGNQATIKDPFHGLS